MYAPCKGAGAPVSAAQSFVVEGVRLVEEAFEAGWEAELVLHSGDLNPRGLALLQGFQERGATIEAVSPNVMQAASDTQTPQGILAVVHRRSLAMPERAEFHFHRSTVCVTRATWAACCALRPPRASRRCCCRRAAWIHFHPRC